jgi:hypothetical protein
MAERLRKWFGLRCLLMCCPGEVVTMQSGKTCWRCVECLKHTKPE